MATMKLPELIITNKVDAFDSKKGEFDLIKFQNQINLEKQLQDRHAQRYRICRDAKCLGNVLDFVEDDVRIISTKVKRNVSWNGYLPTIWMENTKSELRKAKQLAKSRLDEKEKRKAEKDFIFRSQAEDVTFKKWKKKIYYRIPKLQ